MNDQKEIDRLGSGRLISSSIRRRLFRNSAIIICFAFVTGTILTAGYLSAGAQMSVQAGMDKLGADMIVIPYDPYARNSGLFLTGQISYLYFNESILGDVATTPGVLRASPQVFAGYIPAVNWSHYSVRMVGYDPASDFSVEPLLEEGRSSQLRADEVVVGHYIIGAVGSSVQIAEKQYTIADRLTKTGFSPDVSVYFNMPEAYAVSARLNNSVGEGRASPGQISAVLVKADHAQGINSVLFWVTSLNPGVLVYPMSALSQQVSDQLSATTQALYLTTAAIVLVSMPLVALISMMGANERRGEIGILRALGADKGFVFRMVFAEAVILAAVGGLAGVIGSSTILYVLQAPLTAGLNTSFMWPSLPTILAQVSLALLCGVALAGLAAIWPAYVASKMEPYDSLRRGTN
jgi:putative ABC transport system permease protein